MSKTVCIVQARTTSARFPCKILAGLQGRPMLAHVLERASFIRGVDQVVLAVPENDASLVGHLWDHVYGGYEHDVLGRYANAAMKYEADIIIRVTGDCPLLAPDLISQGLLDFTACGSKYIAGCQPYCTVADGWDFEIFDRRTLVNADRFARKNEREHVTTWMRTATPVYGALCPRDYTALKCSVDTREDLVRASRILEQLYERARIDELPDFSHKATWEAWERAGRP